MSVTDVTTSPVTELTVEEARAMFEKRCREELGVSADEFRAQIQSGDIPPDWPAEAVARLEILLPFAR
jgi:hypothetical protein